MGQFFDLANKIVASKRPADGLGHQGAIKRVIVVAKEHLRAAVAALGDMVRQAGNDGAGKTAHAPVSRREWRDAVQCTVTVIPVVVLGEHFFSPILAATSQLVYVHPDARGGSAAVKLLRAMRRWAASHGAKDLYVSVTSGIDAARTDRFLRHMGFRQTGGNYVLEGV